ncbi:uncharacterized protein HMPREF1541_06724 [Cyphellophora europaea CBS 101466]|uniref:Uncharacterized protein n=1 Tax=Cyphellophora europaea (strain CBS 101466) TaxID=1220924 RepID=W2RQD3_CYPE1|nr:uncharacterized protein HMPREF1541_06724 [Cyphellophora europaea CBS 101466]ETN38687.1 hypothetical protein HMPREF1541_06724 [Cyphellophora europaea CBS 101466]
MANPQTRAFLGRHSSKLLLGGLSLGGVYAFYAYRAPQPKGTYEPNPMRTPGVQNIEKAYQRGGATSTHTVAHGGTTQGQTNDLTRDNAGTSRPKGFDDEPRGMGDEQRTDGQMKGKVGETFDKMKYGTSTDK